MMQKRHWGLCVFFTIIISSVMGCHTDDISEMDFQKRIDNQAENKIYQFPADSYVTADIKHLKNNNLDLKTAQNKIIQSQALYEQAFAGYLPQITADMSGNQQINNVLATSNEFVMRPQGNLKFYSFNANIRLVPDIFGRTRINNLMADNQIKADYLKGEATYLEILNQYTKNYHLVCATKSLLNVHKNMLLLSRNIEQSAKIRYQLGRSNIVDFYNAQDSLINAKIELNKAKQNHNLALQSYYSLIGTSLTKANKNALCQNGSMPLMPHKNITIHLQSLDNRPDIKAIQYAMQNAYHNVDLSLKAIYPDVTILFTSQNFSDKLSNLLDVKQFISNFAAQITQTLYDGGVRDSQINLSKANAKLMKKTYYNNILTAGNTLITLGENFNLVKKLRHQAKNRVHIAKKALDAATRNYKLGNIEFVQLINSQRNYYVAQTEYIVTSQNMRNVYVDILTNSGISPVKI